MESIFEKRETELFNLDADDLSNEDCCFLLRALEKRAFEFVVCALRETILDHMKSLFFISDEDFFLRLRLSANDPVLSKIAQELNPSYDNASEWLAASYSLGAIDFPKVVQLNTSPNKNASQCARKMIDQMDTYNSLLTKEKEAFKQLIQVHRHVYDVHGRVDIAREKKGLTISNKNLGTVRHVGRPRKSELPQYASAKEEMEDTKKIKKVIKLMEDLKSKNKSQADSCGNQPSNSQIFSLENGSDGQAKHPILNKEAPKIQSEFSIHYTGGANIVVIDPEDQNTGKETKVRKRKSKQDDLTCVCARVMPFIFECPPGQMKPPRGNPDKRTTKRSLHGFSSSSDILNLGGYVGMHSHHSNSLSSVNYYASKPRMSPTQYAHTNAPADKNQETLLLSAKRVRAVSVGEGKAATTHHIQKLFRPSLLHQSNVTADHAGNVKSNGNIPSSTSLLKSSKIAIQDSSGHGDKNAAPQVNSIEQRPQSLEYSVGGQLEASGLDVLASVSLLDAIAQTSVTRPENKTQNNDVPSTSIIGEVRSAQEVEPLRANGQACTSRSEYSTTTTTTVCIPPRLTACMPRVNETTQNFLKKHALENEQIDEDTTLGSILADPALRNKLFMSTSKSMTILTSSAGLKTVKSSTESIRPVKTKPTTIINAEEKSD